MSDTPPAIAHLETYLGTIDPKAGYWGWDRSDGVALQGIAFRDQPRVGATTIVSLRLGHHELCSPRGHVRQELLLACWDEFVCARVAQLLPVVADYALNEHLAYAPGQVCELVEPLLPDSQFDTLLCVRPFLFPQAFAVCEETDPRTEFIWLVPVTPAEAREAAEGFTDELIARWRADRVDLLDWHRE
jgi:Suppressor of fused protein (SUFU)